MTRIGFDVELTPSDKFDVTFTYFRRNVDYPNRPDRGAAARWPARADPRHACSRAKYDTFTVDVGFRPNAKVELDAFYTYEKDANDEPVVER